MTQPTAYTRGTDFSDFEALNPTDPKSGASLDAEFDAIKTTLEQTLANLAILQRDDTKLGNLTVHVEALDTTARALLTTEAGTIKGAWTTATAYAVKDVVTESGTTYICAVAHTSGTFATDLTAAKWLAISTPDTADDITYDNTTSSLAATTAQDALDEIDGDLDTHIAATTAHGISSFMASVLDDTTSLLAQATLGLVISQVVSGTDYLRFVQLDGDGFICFNCDYDTDNSYWYRLDEEKYAFRVAFYYNNVPGEADQGIVFERVLPSLVSGSPSGLFTAESPTKKIGTTYAAFGGFELMFDLTQFRDLVVGGLGIEIDGAGTIPYVRYMHGHTYSSKIYHGIVYNAFNDFSGTDRRNKPSFFVGARTDSATGLVQEFVVMWAPANTPGGASTPDTTTPSFSDIIAVTLNSGTTPLTNQGWLRKGTVLEDDPYALNAQTVQAHGLGVTPAFCVTEIVCKTADLNYAVDDVVELGAGFHGDGGANSTITILKDATNVTLSVANSTAIRIANKSTLALAAITPSSWKIRVTPYAFV